VDVLSAAFTALGWSGKTPDLFNRYVEQQAAGDRVVVVGEIDEKPVGYACVVWTSDYAHFREVHIPEIVDLNVLPRHRRQGLGTALLNAAESMIASRATAAGIAVGLSADYAPAMLLYLKRGYLPDGQGIAYQGKPVPVGTTLTLDDSANLMLTKRLR
jgi:GNAT superfamily N-acetyltransferase